VRNPNPAMPDQNESKSPLTLEEFKKQSGEQNPFEHHHDEAGESHEAATAEKGVL